MVLVTQRGPTVYKAGGYNVMGDHCVFVSVCGPSGAHLLTPEASLNLSCSTVKRQVFPL